MLDMGFIHDIRRILKLLPERRQNLLFSATFADQIRALTDSILRDPVEIAVSPPNATADTVEQWVYPVDKKRKSAALLELVVDNDWDQVLVFSRTKHGANRLAGYLDKAGVNAAAIHGNKSQAARTRALSGFKRGDIRVLVATDIAARGLDIAQLPQVVNFDLPNVPEDYVHRIGRTGRAGSAGCAYSLVCADEIDQLNGIERLIRRHIAREYVDGFEPEHELPQSKSLGAAGGSRRPGGKNGGGNGGKTSSRGRNGARDGRRNGGQRAEGGKRRPRRRRRAGAASA